MKKLLFPMIAILIIGCGPSYEKVSQDIDGLREEQKAIVNLELALDGYIEAQKKYQAKLQELETVREKNDDDGRVLGPEFDSSIDLEAQKELLKKNQDIISDKIHALEENRKDIVNSDAGIN